MPCTTGASSFFSTVSVCSWMCAQLPQIYKNYTLKLALGISPFFLGLWFLGDFLSFTSCLLNDVVLKFQVYISLFFLCNDVTLCYQYYAYYRVESPDDSGLADATELHEARSIRIRRSQSSDSESQPSSYGSTDSKTLASAVVVLANAGVAAAADGSAPQSLGAFLAWACTVVYVSSRCPQLYKNYRRRSVEGISPVLFGAALVGNLTYTISILTSCAFIDAESKSVYLWRQLPYILGSSGTILFDGAYFYQRFLYGRSK